MKNFFYLFLFLNIYNIINLTYYKIKIIKKIRKRKASSTSNASAANRVPIIVENMKTNEVIEYLSITEASKVLGVHKNAVGQAIANNRLVKKTYRVTKK